MKTKDFKKGDRAYIFRERYFKGNNLNDCIIKCNVESIGYKYVTIRLDSGITYRFKVFTDSFSPSKKFEYCLILEYDWRVLLFKDYEDLQNYQEYIELDKWFKELYNTSLSLNQLKSIKQIVESEEN